MIVVSFHWLGMVPVSKMCWKSILPLGLSGLATLLELTAQDGYQMLSMVGGWRGEMKITDVLVVGVLLLLKRMKKLFCKRGTVRTVDHCRFRCSAHHDV